MATMEVKIATDNTEVIKELADEATIAALEMIGLLAEAYAIKKCPVDTGRLRGSITHGTLPEEDTAFIGTNVEYAPYVEYGTSRMKAQPFFKPAIQNHQAEYFQIWEAYMRNA